MTKKKIIIIIIAIIFVIAISLLLIFIKNKSVKISNYNEEENTNSSINENEIIENVVTDVNTTKNELQNTTISNVSSNIENNTKSEENNSKKTTNVKKEVSSKPKTQTSSSTVTKANTPEITKEETQSTQQVPSTISPQQQLPVEEYKRNDDMINRIKQVIQANETDNMKNFGYSIVVDSSIKEQTNQFTYAESRVINSIRNKFGTIKIYAENFYKNGQLVMTECYIL